MTLFSLTFVLVAMWISSCTAYVSHIRRDVNKVTIKNTKRIVSNVIIRYMSDQSDLIPMDLEQYNNNNKKAPSISWYPGHIAKAERELADYLKKVDVVIEVRDARIPLSTTHPMVPSWVGNKPLIIAIARLDQISKKALADWKEYYAMNPAHPERPDARVYFIDGKTGSGTLSLKRQALKAGVDINEKRVKKGIQPRAVRAAVIGFPNVGKSALINRLLGKKMAKSRNLPGVTRSLQWVRLGGISGSQENNIELLDSPGIIPARQFDQAGALKLAICNDIGEASYDRVVVAAAMCDLINSVAKRHRGYCDMVKIRDRYGIPFDTMTGEEIVYQVAEKMYQGNSISASDKLLGDFRKGFLSLVSLEAPVDALKLFGDENVRLSKKYINPSADRSSESSKPLSHNENNNLQSSSIKKKGLDSVFDSIDIGKGNYDGW